MGSLKPDCISGTIPGGQLPAGTAELAAKSPTADEPVISPNSSGRFTKLDELSNTVSFITTVFQVRVL
jgi:hypothetical protein